MWAPYVVTPLVSAALYALAAMALKRATGNGAGPWRVAFTTNWIQALFFLPLWLSPAAAPFAWAHVGHAVIAGLAFFVGQVFTFLALSRGDVSVTTPVLGTKVVFVALLAALFTDERITLHLWSASLLAIAATALLGGGKSKAGRAEFRRSLVYGFTAAIAFALTDILTQKWAPAWGARHFAPMVFLTVAICSLGMIPHFSAPLRDLPRPTWPWLVGGALILTLQAGGIAYSIMTFGKATLVNILYATRGLWAVVAVWLVGPWFGNAERDLGRAVMIRRLAGAMLLLGAVFLAMYSPK